MSELRGATDILNAMEDAKIQLQNEVSTLTKNGRALEKELDDCYLKLSKKEEDVAMLLDELEVQKKAKQGIEQAHQARTKEFLSRFDGLKK